jgi:hypothetical protein
MLQSEAVPSGTESVEEAELGERKAKPAPLATTVAGNQRTFFLEIWPPQLVASACQSLGLVSMLVVVKRGPLLGEAAYSSFSKVSRMRGA